MTPRETFGREPDLRYLRRRANLRVRLSRQLRSGLRLLGIMLLQAGIAVVLVLSGIRATRTVLGSELFEVVQIDVDGARRASDPEIHEQLSRFLGRNLFEIDLAQIETLIGRDRWVAGARASRRLPGTLRVQIDERRPSAHALIGAVVHLIDDQGVVIGPSGPGAADELPVLIGFEGLDRTALALRLRRGVSALSALRQAAPTFAADLSELDLSARDRITAQTVVPGPPLLLDPERVERNVENYLRLRVRIEREWGAVRYVDLRWRDRVTVLPFESSS